MVSFTRLPLVRDVLNGQFNNLSVRSQSLYKYSVYLLRRQCFKARSAVLAMSTVASVFILNVLPIGQSETDFVMSLADIGIPCGQTGIECAEVTLCLLNYKSY